MHTPLSTLLKEKGYVTHSISPTASCFECASKLNQFGIGALLIIENNILEGIVSERDFVRKLVCHKTDPTQITVSEIMTKRENMTIVPPTMTVQEAMKVMTNKRFRHLPVLENEKIQGMISIGDLTRWVMLQQEQEIADLTGYIHGTPPAKTPK